MDDIIIPGVYERFGKWLDNILSADIPENTAAFCFNLYDEAMEGEVYGIQAAAADRFDADDKDCDWAYYQIWNSEEDLFRLDFSDDADKGFEFVQSVFTAFVREYLRKGRYKDRLLGSQGIGIGHVEGDISLIYINENNGRTV